MDFREDRQFYQSMITMQRDTRILLATAIGLPGIVGACTALGQVPGIVSWLSIMCACVCVCILSFNRYKLTDWWMLWPGPLLHITITDPLVYAQNIQWLLENHSRDVKVLGVGVIKFKQTNLAVLFKMM
jgi:hypothetical protein